MLTNLQDVLSAQQRDLDALLAKEQALLDQVITEGRTMEETKPDVTPRVQALKDALDIRDQSLAMLETTMLEAKGNSANAKVQEAIIGLLSANNIVKVLEGSRG